MHRTNPLDNKQNRSGWTLIELTVVISLLSTFSFLGVSLINRLMELDTAIAASASHSMTIGRFADQLRADAHLSVAVKEVENGFDLIEHSGNLINYRIAEAKITRRTKLSRHATHESYQFVDCELSFHTDPQKIQFSIEKTEPLEMKSFSSQLATKGNTETLLLIPLGRQVRYLTSSSTHGDEL